MNSLQIAKLAVKYRKLTDILKKEGFEEEWATSDRVTMMLVKRGMDAYHQECPSLPLGVVGDRGAEGARGGGPEDMEEK